VTTSTLPEVQVTPRLLLRPWRAEDESDVAAAFSLYSDPGVYPWLGSSPAPWADRQETRERLARWGGVADGLRGLWAVVPFGGADVPVGTVLLVQLPRADGTLTDDWEIGWHLSPAVWGRGYATEAAGAMVSRARAAGLPEVHAVVLPGNGRSLAVCDRLRMTRTGPTDAYYGVELVDHVLPLARR
jgi:RimJ/RimL family protein N-acetyltransferase